jgi:hypothetical protein
MIEADMNIPESKARLSCVREKIHRGTHLQMTDGVDTVSSAAVQGDPRSHSSSLRYRAISSASPDAAAPADVL